jgi:hypothetical protein
MGSAKFASFVAFVALMAATVQVALLVSMPFVQRVSPGPYALLFALFVLFYGVCTHACASQPFLGDCVCAGVRHLFTCL